MDIRHAVGVKVGVPTEKLSDVLTYRQSPLFNGRERAALEFCERTIRDDLEMSDECLVRLRQHFAEAEIVELTFIIGYQTFASKFAKAFKLTPQGFSSGRPNDDDEWAHDGGRKGRHDVRLSLVKSE
jgi:alkylhydroperoxidase family enzyme